MNWKARTLATEDYEGFCLRLNTFMAGMPGEKIVGESDCHLMLHTLCQLMRVEFQSEVHQLGGWSDLEVIFPAMSACLSSNTAGHRRPS